VVSVNLMSAGPPRWKSLIAFGIIYLVWGSTFFAIRVGVLAVAPLLLAAMRFSAAGVLMCGWGVWRARRWPRRREWGSIAVLALLIFVMDYGLLFTAERRIPSGVAAVILATIPAFTAIGEIIWLRTQRMTVQLAAALLIGLTGVAVLVVPTAGVAGPPVNWVAVVALLVAAMSWSGGSILMRRLPLPTSKIMSAGTQMLTGGLFLWLMAVLLGQTRHFDPDTVSWAAWGALLYLVVAGSLLGFGAYTWLIHHHSPTRVGTYAYVNPVIAVIIGYAYGGEPLTVRTVLGAAFVVSSVIVILAGRARVVPGRACACAASVEP
jgi:drug/metabolite transporter (DMT)-like permease